MKKAADSHVVLNALSIASQIPELFMGFLEIGDTIKRVAENKLQQEK